MVSDLRAMRQMARLDELLDLDVLVRDELVESVFHQ